MQRRIQNLNRLAVSPQQRLQVHNQGRSNPCLQKSRRLRSRICKNLLKNEQAVKSPPVDSQSTLLLLRTEVGLRSSNANS